MLKRTLRIVVVAAVIVPVALLGFGAGAALAFSLYANGKWQP